MKTYVGMQVRIHSFLSLDAKWAWVVSFTTRLLYLWQKSCKRAPNPLNKGMDQPCNWVGHFGQKINLLALPGIKQSRDGHPVASLLYWLCYPGINVITRQNKTQNVPSHQSLSCLTTFKSHKEFRKNKIFWFGLLYISHYTLPTLLKI